MRMLGTGSTIGPSLPPPSSMTRKTTSAAITARAAIPTASTSFLAYLSLSDMESL